MINEAVRLIHLDDRLTAEDRTDLMRAAERMQQQKDEMYPLHAHVVVNPNELSGRASAYDTWDANKETALPVY